MRWIPIALLLLTAVSEARVKPRPGKCETIDMKLTDKQNLEYPLIHHVKTKKISVCEEDVAAMLKSQCRRYAKFKASYKHELRKESDFNIDGKISYHDGTRYQLATVSGNCTEPEITWRKEE